MENVNYVKETQLEKRIPIGGILFMPECFWNEEWNGGERTSRRKGQEGPEVFREFNMQRLCNQARVASTCRMLESG